MNITRNQIKGCFSLFCARDDNDVLDYDDIEEEVEDDDLFDSLEEIGGESNLP